MSAEIPAKKRVAVLAATICCFAVMSVTLPAIAARHSIHAVYVVIPLVAILTVALIYLLIAVLELKRTA